MPNIEIKARYDDLGKARAIAERLRAKLHGTDHQVDTYFLTSAGRLKLRESSLSGAQLVPYLRPNQAGPKKSQYLVLPIADAALCKTLFAEMLGLDVVVDKVRTIYLLDNVRIHLDEVKNLGNFFEFEAVYADPAQEEAEYAKVGKLLKEFEIHPSALIMGSYRELLKEWQFRQANA